MTFSVMWSFGWGAALATWTFMTPGDQLIPACAAGALFAAGVNQAVTK